jgi:hypothetical protein
MLGLVRSPRQASAPCSTEALTCSFCGRSQDRVRKVIAAPAAVVCSDCIGSMMGLVYGADRSLFDDIVAGAAEPEPSCRGEVETYAGHYIDWAGAAAARIDNDGDMLTLTVRGRRFSGPDFDALEPQSAGAADLFRIERGVLADFRLDYAMPLPVACAGATADRQLFVRIHIAGRGEPGACVQLSLSGREENAAGFGDFASAFADLAARSGEAVIPKACIACAHAGYNPAGHGLYGALMCFRGLKAERRAARERGDLTPLLGRQDRFVQETWLCGDWAPAPTAELASA